MDRAALAAEPDQAGPAAAEYVMDLFDGFVSRFGEGAGPTDWVARDPTDVVRDHAVDPAQQLRRPDVRPVPARFIDLYDLANGDGSTARCGRRRRSSSSPATRTR